MPLNIYQKKEVKNWSPFSNKPYLNKSSILVYNNSITIETTREPFLSIPPRPESKRGIIQEFSQKSRFRMLKTLSKIHIQSYNSILFITLTYHLKYPDNLTPLKNHLHKFLIYLKRLYPESANVWRVELQKRGVPHFHLLFFTTKKIDEHSLEIYKRNIQKIWFSVINDKNDYMKLYSIDIKNLNNPSKVFPYISKYTAKVNDNSKTPYLGRRWGYSHNLILKEVAMIKITDELLEIFTKNILLWLDKKNVTDQKFIEYIETSPKVTLLIPLKDFYIIFEKSIESWKRKNPDTEIHYNKIELEFSEDTLLQRSATVKMPSPPGKKIVFH